MARMISDRARKSYMARMANPGEMNRELIDPGGPLEAYSNSLEGPKRFPETGQAPRQAVSVTSANRIVLATDPRSPGADRFRLIRMALRELRAASKLQTVMVTSPFPQDGKSTVALNLATVLAERGQKAVLLVEADLHCPSIAQNLGIRPSNGLAECLEEGSDPLAAITRLDPLQWFLLQAGKPLSNPTDLLQSGPLPTILEKLSPHFDWIIVDTPPLAPLSDALVISRCVDASVLVVRADQTSRVAVDEAVAVLGRSRIAGVILNGARGLNRLYGKYKSYYGRPGKTAGA
jgi:capsular exopolysaccharide synthesis family protein